MKPRSKDLNNSPTALRAGGIWGCRREIQAAAVPTANTTFVCNKTTVGDSIAAQTRFVCAKAYPTLVLHCVEESITRARHANATIILDTLSKTDASTVLGSRRSNQTVKTHPTAVEHKNTATVSSAIHSSVVGAGCVSSYTHIAIIYHGRAKANAGAVLSRVGWNASATLGANPTRVD